MGIAGEDIGGDGSVVLPGALDLLGQAFHLPADVVLLVDMRGAKLVELADFGIDLDLFHDGGIARGDGLDLGVGERAAFEVFGLAHGDAAVHHLIDEAGLGFEHLPHIGVERSFGDVAVDLDFGVVVALPQDSAFALLDVARPPRGVEVMEGDEPLLHVGPGAHFLGGAEEDADAPGIDRVKQRLSSGRRSRRRGYRRFPSPECLWQSACRGFRHRR